MRRPLQGLLISEELAEKIENDEKKITIRAGQRDYEIGAVLIGCPTVPWSSVKRITNVRHTILKEITPEEYKLDGFNSFDEMISGLSEFYSDLTPDSEMTIIRWD